MQRQSDLAELVRQACIDAALEAYESGGISGLCAEGRWELAIQAIRCLDLRPLYETADEGEDSEAR
jgi:hypothetical protein